MLRIRTGGVPITVVGRCAVGQIDLEGPVFFP